jgi:hypothetical protein
MKIDKIVEAYKDFFDYEEAKKIIEKYNIEPTIVNNGNNKHKIALCLSGYYDSRKDNNTKGDDGFNYIFRKILINNDVDVYIHSWDIVNKNKIIDRYGKWIKSVHIENQIDFSEIYYKNKLDSIQEWGNSYKNIFSHFYSVQKSFELLKENKCIYDCVIKTRFDLSRTNRLTSGPQFKNKYPVQCINFNKNYDMNKFYYARYDLDLIEGPADMWFYSNYSNMINFAELFDFLSKEVNTDNYEYRLFCRNSHGGIANGIRAWKWFLINYGLWKKRLSLKSEWE